MPESAPDARRPPSPVVGGGAPASLAAALVQLQAALPRITKTADGQYGKYADLNVITEAIKPLLIELGLLWICLPTLMDGRFVLDYHMLHADSGERGLQGVYPLDSATPQGRGSEITYARRYALCAALDIAPAGTDDDGQCAQDEPRDWHAPANPRTRKAARHQAARSGPLPDDEFTAAPLSEDPGTITSSQIKQLSAWFTRAGITGARDCLAYAQMRLDDPGLEASDKLSMRQAEDLIAHLKEDAR